MQIIWYNQNLIVQYTSSDFVRLRLAQPPSPAGEGKPTFDLCVMLDNRMNVGATVRRGRRTLHPLRPFGAPLPKGEAEQRGEASLSRKGFPKGKTCKNCECNFYRLSPWHVSLRAFLCVGKEMRKIIHIFPQLINTLSPCGQLSKNPTVYQQTFFDIYTPKNSTA